MIGQALAVEPPIQAGMFDSSPSIVTVRVPGRGVLRVAAETREASDIAEALESELSGVVVQFEEWQITGEAS